MELTAILWLLLLIITGGCVFLSVFALILFADLESDYINPIELCRKLNKFVLPEAVGLWLSSQLYYFPLCYGVMTALLFLTGHWWEFLFNLPLLLWYCKGFWENNYLLDATTIFRTVGFHKKQTGAKLGFYMITFFYYLYKLIYTLVKGMIAHIE